MNCRWAGMLLFVFCLVNPLRAGVVIPDLVTNLICYYDFDHPVSGNAARENDLGSSGTEINLINGGAAMRVSDGAYVGSMMSLQTQQINPASNGNDDWKAGVYQTNGITALDAFGSVAGITLMGWIKPTDTNPNLNSGTAATNDFYNAVGLFGLLAGNSEGHGVRALLEVINVSGTLRLVALGRPIDTGSSLILAATNDWQVLIPSNTWTHLVATFDFDNGTMALYRNGDPLAATYTSGGDPWGVIGGAEPDLTSSSNPAGIKIGGSYPQNTQEFNAFNGRFDDLMLFNKVLSATEVQSQYASFLNVPPVISVSRTNGQVHLQWPVTAFAFSLESKTNLVTGDWIPASEVQATNGQIISVTLPATAAQQFFRLKK